MDLQKLVDVLGEAGRQNRSSYHVTLGDMIELLRTARRGSKIFVDGEPSGLSGPCSYRGYYSDLALQPSTERSTVRLLSTLEGCVGRSFSGYKGGSYRMSEDTPLWAASLGDCGKAIVSASLVGKDLHIVTKDVR